MKILLVVLAVLVGWIGMARAEWPIDAMNEQIEKTNVIVGGICSGTIIDKENRIVLTAHHCIDGMLVEIEVKDVDPKTGDIKTRKVQKRLPLTISVRKIIDYEIVGSVEHLVRIVGDDAEHDIAILQVVDKTFVPEMVAPLAADSYTYKRGLKVFAIGNPAIDFDNSITMGIISAPQRTLDFGDGKLRKVFQHSAETVGGNSGGAVLNDSGELIGTHSAGLPGAAIGFAVPISYTKDLLKRAGFGQKAPEVCTSPYGCSK